MNVYVNIPSIYERQHYMQEKKKAHNTGRHAGES